MNNKWGKFIGVSFAWLALVVSALAYTFIKDEGGYVITWHPGVIPMQVKLAGGPTLSDGTSQSSSVVVAMSEWNAQLGMVQFTGQEAGPGTYDVGNDINEIVMDSTMGGADFGANVLAVTISFRDGNTRTESDIIFNSAYTWDSYRGNLRVTPDIRRVALHELGHALGLAHPDQAGQAVTAIMNSAASNDFRLQFDDINGGRELYGAPGVRPANDDFAQAAVISLNAGFAQVKGTNVAATSESSEPAHAGDVAQRSVWWRWAAPSNGRLIVSTMDSNFDTKLAVYTGSTLSSLAELGANDDVDSGIVRTSSLALEVVAGTVYYFAIDGWDGYFGAITLSLDFAPVAGPRITAASVSQGVLPGEMASFTIGATGVGSVNYQWQVAGPALTEWINLVNDGVYSGAMTPTLSVAASATLHGNSYRCVVTDSLGSTVSLPAILRVATAGPALTNRPLTRIVMEGESVAVSISAVGYGTLSYQWKHDGVTLTGRNTATLDLGNVGPADHGRYEVLVTDANGTARSVFNLHVAPKNVALAAWGRNDATLGQANVPRYPGKVGVLRSGRTYGMVAKGGGTVMRWGTAAPAVPISLDDVVDLSIGGGGQSIALKGNGTLVGWGSSEEEQLNFPAGLTEVVSLATNGRHSIALRADGTVITWGRLNASYGPPPAGLNDIVAVAAGSEHYLALRADGSVVEWGQVWAGGFAKPANLTDVTAIAAGDQYNMALRANGTVVLWRNTDGFVPLNLTNVVAIAAGAGHMLALRGDRTVAAWTQYNTGYGEAAVPSTMGNVRAIDGGLNYSVAAYSIALGLPAIVTHPTSQSGTVGQTIVFSVSAVGEGLGYEWRRNGVVLIDGENVAGATSATLRVSNIQVGDAGSYTVTVRNPAGNVLSSARLRVANAPVIATRPLSRVAQVGQTVAVSATVHGSDLTYQWKHNGRVIPGATGPALALPSATLADRGRYELIVTNLAGSTARSNFVLNIWSPNSWIKAWGSGNSGQTDVPAGLNNVVSLSAGSSHALVARADGTVSAWGTNNVGQIAVPSGLTNVMAVAAGGSHSVALKADGTVVAWGSNDDGRATVPAGLSNVVSIAASFAGHTLALRADGTVVGWGRNLERQTLVPTGLSDVVSISANGFSSLALKADGTIVTWGSGGTRTITTMTGMDIVSASFGSGVILVVKTNGALVTLNEYGDIRNNTLAGLNDIQALSAGAQHNLALRYDGTLVGWGTNYAGQATIPTALTGVLDCSAGYDFSMVLVSSELPPLIDQPPQSLTVVQGEIGGFIVKASGGPPLNYQWQRFPAAGSAWVDIGNGSNYSGATSAMLTITSVTMAMLGDQFRCVVSNPFGSTASATASLSVSSSALFTSVASGFFHSLFTMNDGSLWGMGSNYFGQLGVSQQLGDTYGPTRPVQIATDVAKAIPITNFFSLFIKNDGTLWGMGANNSGSLGDGSFTHRSVPVLIAADVQSAAGGDGHTLFIKNDRTLWGTGNNDYGQLGDGTLMTRNRPMQIATEVASVSAGGGCSLFVKTDGTLWAMGFNLEGQLGDGTQTNQKTPIQIASGVAKAVAAGSYSLFIKTDGTLWAMGANSSGQLGDGTTARRLVPVQVASEVVAAAGSGHSFFIKTNGTLWGMGGNDNGQLGVAQSGIIKTPVQITTGVKSVTAGSQQGFYIKNDGRLWAMGSSSYGQLGIGSSSSSNSPQAVVLGAPIITAHPMTQTITASGMAQFQVAATGVGGLIYQWQRMPDGQNTWSDIGNGEAYTGATGVSLTISGATRAMSGDQIRCQVSNPFGMTVSNAVALIVNGQSQTISFPGMIERPYTSTPIALVATASSGLGVSFSVVSGPAVVSASTLSLTGAGAVSIKAEQFGNDTYDPALPVERTFYVTSNMSLWSLVQFSADELADTAISGPNADPDGDMLPNLMEYALGLEPKQANASGLPDVSIVGASWAYTYVKPVSVADVIYVVEMSTDLASWSTNGVVVELVSSAEGVETWRATHLIGGAPNIFFRLRVTQ